MVERPLDALVSGPCMGLIIAAHPDDETIGAAALMRRLSDCSLVHVTDGAPRQARFWTQAPGSPPPGSATQYAQIRRDELGRALRLAGIEPQRTSCLGVRDQEAVLAITGIAAALADSVATLRPDMILTHAYEGGHPDHDAVAVAVWAAGRLLVRRGLPPPPVVEMALYHGASGALTPGEFLPRPGVDEVVMPLSELELQHKRAMLDCFASQREVLAPFYALTAERFRLAPSYGADDFGEPPHGGLLMYERWSFPLSGATWRQAAARALHSLGLFHAAGGGGL